MGGSGRSSGAPSSANALARLPGSRRVLALKVAAIKLEACHAREIIEQAFARFGVPEIVNTDQGSQFTAEESTHAVLSRRCRLSMDGKGAWRYNVFVERLWRTIKYERVYLQANEEVSAARSDLDTTSTGTTASACIRASRSARPNRPIGRCCPSWPWLPRMKTPVHPESPTALDGSSHSDHCRRGQLCTSSTRTQSLYLSE